MTAGRTISVLAIGLTLLLASPATAEPEKLSLSPLISVATAGQTASVQGEQTSILDLLVSEAQARLGEGGSSSQVKPELKSIIELYQREIVALGVFLTISLILGLYLFSQQLKRGIERRTGELAAVTSEYKDILDHMQDIYFRTNLEGELVWISLACNQMLGYPRDQLLGTQMGKLFFRASDRDQFLKALDASKGGLQGYEMRLRHSNGSEIWTEVNAQYYRHEEEIIAGVEGNVRNISERKVAEQKSKELTGQLQQAQKMESIGVLAGGIAHDFNNLLVGVMGNAELAIMDTPESAETHQYLQQILKASKRGADLVGQILAYSGKGHFAMGYQNLNTIISDISELLSSAIGKQTELELHLMDELPFVYGDKNQLTQLVMNLMTNASEALRGRPGSIRLETGINRLTENDLSRMYISTGLKADDYVYLKVADTGCGMDEETQKRIFDPFFTTKTNGTGLGLAALLGIVNGHKGTLALQSAPAKGSCFTVYLPMVSIAQPKYLLSADQPADQQLSDSATVLVVDDEEAVRKVASGFLEHAGMRVLTANDGEMCVEIFRQHADAIDLVVLDLTMPKMNGEEAFHAIQSIRPDVPILLSSGFSETEAVARLSRYGLAGFIRKPYLRKHFIGEIRRQLSS